MEQKIFTAPFEFKEDGLPGEFKAVFATIGVTDLDFDWTEPGAFSEQDVVIEPWNHAWTLPAGKGSIKANKKEAWIEGRFFLDTEVGKENYQTVKNLGPLAEWSYTFNILKSTQADPKEYDGANRRLQKMDVVGVSPVTRGAGINTRTVAIKSEGADDEKPYPNEHACRLRPPGNFQEGSFVRTTRKHEGKVYSVIQGRLKGEDTLTDQAFRYKKDVWTASAARSHCTAHDGSFEAASNEGEASNDAGKSSVDILTKINIIEACVIASLQE